jgi:hypothetical protein
MALGLVQVLHPSGARVFRETSGLIRVVYAVIGDGVGGPLNMGYGPGSRLAYFRGDLSLVLTDDPTNKRVTATVPATLANGKITYVELILLP